MARGEDDEIRRFGRPGPLVDSHAFVYLLPAPTSAATPIVEAEPIATGLGFRGEGKLHRGLPGSDAEEIGEVIGWFHKGLHVPSALTM